MKPAYIHSSTASDVFFGQVSLNGIIHDLYHTPLGRTTPEYPFIVIRSSNHMTEYVLKSLENIRNIAGTSLDYNGLYYEVLRVYDEKVGVY